jgi:hypothetical protein
MVAQLAKKFPGFYGIIKLITVFTRARHMTVPSSSGIIQKPANGPVPILGMDDVIPT